MIISHKHRFIFVKTSKTAGTSIEIALSGYCGSNDVITKNAPADEIIRKNMGYPGPQNHLLPFTEYKMKDWARFLVKGRRLQLRSHFPATFIKQFIGNPVWDTYYQFCFERNPWDRVVSLYYHHRQDRKLKNLIGQNISDFINRGFAERLKIRGSSLYRIDGKIAIDRVCLYENLEAELEYVCNHILGIPEPLNLPRAKGQYRKDQRHYREILSPEDRDRIATIFEREIKLFGYEF